VPFKKRQDDDCITEAQLLDQSELRFGERPADAHQPRAFELAPHLAEDAQQNVQALTPDRAPDVQQFGRVVRRRAQQPRGLCVEQGFGRRRVDGRHAVVHDLDALGPHDAVREQLLARVRAVAGDARGLAQPFEHAARHGAE
jgi:hypothetical protein